MEYYLLAKLGKGIAMLVRTYYDYSSNTNYFRSGIRNLCSYMLLFEYTFKRRLTEISQWASFYISINPFQSIWYFFAWERMRKKFMDVKMNMKWSGWYLICNQDSFLPFKIDWVGFRRCLCSFCYFNIFHQFLFYYKWPVW